MSTDNIEQNNIGTEPNPDVKFRISLTKGKLLLTYKTHLSKSGYELWLKNKGKKCECWIAHENADSNNPYEHSHVLIIYHEPIQTTNARYFDYADIHPNIKKVLTKTHLVNVLKYMCKEDDSLTDDMVALAKIYTLTLFERVAECESKKDVLNLAENASEISGLLTMYSLKHEIDEIDPTKNTIDHYWQKQLDEELLGPAPPRKIIWIVGLDGNEGKTNFMLYHTAKYKSLGLCQFGGAKDVGTVMQNVDWNHKHIIVDLPRQAESKSIYEPLEMLKNGFITAIKYRGGNVRFDKPWIVVFANFWPDVTKMSMDRWDIRELSETDNHVYEMVKISAYDILKELSTDEPENDGQWVDGPGWEDKWNNNDFGPKVDRVRITKGIPGLGYDTTGPGDGVPDKGPNGMDLSKFNSRAGNDDDGGSSARAGRSCDH